jgi:hypothetical protein
VTASDVLVHSSVWRSVDVKFAALLCNRFSRLSSTCLLKRYLVIHLPMQLTRSQQQACTAVSRRKTVQVCCIKGNARAGISSDTASKAQAQDRVVRQTMATYTLHTYPLAYAPFKAALVSADVPLLAAAGCQNQPGPHPICSCCCTLLVSWPTIMA